MIPLFLFEASSASSFLCLSICLPHIYQPVRWATQFDPFVFPSSKVRPQAISFATTCRLLPELTSNNSLHAVHLLLLSVQENHRRFLQDLFPKQDDNRRCHHRLLLFPMEWK